MTEVTPAARATILVVDDDALIAMNTVDMLEGLGHEAIEAYSGSEALEILAARRIDAVITDFRMPGMTGLELAEKARALNPDLPILLATGYGEMAEARDLIQLAKPFDERALEDSIRRALLR